MSFLVIIESLINFSYDTHNYWENADFHWNNQKPEGIDIILDRIDHRYISKQLSVYRNIGLIGASPIIICISFYLRRFLLVIDTHYTYIVISILYPFSLVISSRHLPLLVNLTKFMKYCLRELMNSYIINYKILEYLLRHMACKEIQYRRIDQHVTCMYCTFTTVFTCTCTCTTVAHVHVHV